MDDQTARNHRRAPRIPARLNITLQFPEGHRTLVTKDVSYQGVFVVCDDPLPLRKLLRFQTRVEEDGEPLQLLGLVAHRVSLEEAQETGADAGMGLQLFSVGPDVHHRWRHFVRQTYERDPRAREQVRNQEFGRLKLRFHTAQHIARFAEDELATGNVFVRSVQLQPQGSRVFIDIIHPRTGKHVSFEGIVMEFVETPRQSRGMHVMIAEPEAARDRLVAFAQVD